MVKWCRSTLGGMFSGTGTWPAGMISMVTKVVVFDALEGTSRMCTVAPGCQLC